MVTITIEQVIEDKIKATLSRGGWHNHCPIEQAIAGAMEYRRSLNQETLALFDELILKGVLPENAVQTVQYAIDQKFVSI